MFKYHSITITFIFQIWTIFYLNQNQKSQKLPNQLKERRKRINSRKLIRKLKPKEKL